MCSGSEAGSYLRLIDFAYPSTLGLRVIKKEEDPKTGPGTRFPKAETRSHKPELLGLEPGQYES